MTEIPRTEYWIDTNKHGYYERLKNDADSLFYGVDFKEIHVAAAAIGYYKKISEPIKGSKASIGVMSLTSSTSPSLWILKSIAITVKGVEVLGDLRKVEAVIEDYANAGIDILIKNHEEGDDEVYSMALELIDIIETEDIQQSS